MRRGRSRGRDDERAILFTVWMERCRRCAIDLYEARREVKKWQRRLRLVDWNITVRPLTLEAQREVPDADAHTNVRFGAKEAVMYLPLDGKSVENEVAHEMSHIVMADAGVDNDEIGREVHELLACRWSSILLGVRKWST